MNFVYQYHMECRFQHISMLPPRVSDLCPPIGSDCSYLRSSNDAYSPSSCYHKNKKSLSSHIICVIISPHPHGQSYKYKDGFTSCLSFQPLNASLYSHFFQFSLFPLDLACEQFFLLFPLLLSHSLLVK